MKAPNPDRPALQLLASERPLVIGHRGCCAHAPENTLPSFELALAAGADLVELDYHHSRDGVPVVIHDDTLDHTTDAPRQWKQRRIKVAGQTVAALAGLDAGGWFDAKFAGTRVPLLAEALEFISSRGGVTLIEHKSGDAATCVELLRERRLINRVVVISFDWSFLRRFHEIEPVQVLGALGSPARLADGRKPPSRSRRLSSEWLEELAPTGARIAVWNRQVPPASVRLAQRRGLKVWVYTVNEVRRARQLIERGVQGIITNDPGLIRKGIDETADEE